MSKKVFLSFLLLILALGACANEESEQVSPCQNPVVPIEVDFSWNPEQSEPGVEVVFNVVVTHENVPIVDADEVNIEIWEHNNPDYHHMKNTEHVEDGLYTMPWTFEQEGVYYAYYHVTACDMHRMEKELIVVGTPDVDAILAEPDTVEGAMSGDHESGNGHDH
ncbi:FixH family protein [Alkalihalobacterium bogoriense]|uniref:FixH family protein n=1 Tax=Alkalihalobacterium bogoriense TaxID=246272 RepID=UPI000479D709|nr:FixH family protein [Alkalihalobacterium bogoriense]